MKAGTSILTLVLLALIILPGRSQSLDKLKAFSMAIHGSSTLHDWESKVIKGSWNGSLTLDDSKKLSVHKAELTIMVKDIQSEHGRIMDGKTYEAFNSDQYPNIKFVMKNATQNNNQLTVEGSLTMNGTTKPITLNLISKPLANGDIQFSGSYSLKMTDYKMVPPTAMMGTIKVGDEVTLKFDLTISK